jgi:hypothetical protein
MSPTLQPTNRLGEDKRAAAGKDHCLREGRQVLGTTVPELVTLKPR